MIGASVVSFVINVKNKSMDLSVRLFICLSLKTSNELIMLPKSEYSQGNQLHLLVPR